MEVIESPEFITVTLEALQAMWKAWCKDPTIKKFNSRDGLPAHMVALVSQRTGSALHLRGRIREREGKPVDEYFIVYFHQTNEVSFGLTAKEYKKLFKQSK